MAPKLLEPLNFDCRISLNFKLASVGDFSYYLTYTPNKTESAIIIYVFVIPFLVNGP